MNYEIDHSLTTFTSEGKLNQCENASRAAQNGVLCLGTSSHDGCILSSLKTFSKLIDKDCVHKVLNVCQTIGITYAGLNPDFRIIHEKACILAESYKDIYGRFPYIDVFVMNLSRVVQEYTMKGGLRPFGCVVLVAGYVKEDDRLVPRLYQIEPSGTFAEEVVCAAGRESEEAKKYAENRRESLDDNIPSCVCALREFAGVGVAVEDVDVGVLRDGRFVVYKREQVNEIFDSFENK